MSMPQCCLNNSVAPGLVHWHLEDYRAPVRQHGKMCPGGYSQFYSLQVVCERCSDCSPSGSFLATAGDGCSTTTTPPAVAAHAGQCWMEDSWGTVLPRPRGSVRPAHSRQQLLVRNHAVTEPGGEFQLGKSLEAKAERKEGNQRVPPKHAKQCQGTCPRAEEQKAHSQQWGELGGGPAWHVGSQEVR